MKNGKFVNLVAIGLMVFGISGAAVAQTTGPDLIVSASSGPTQAKLGATITGTLTVANIGTVGTVFFQNAFYLSDSPTLTGWNIMLDYQGVPNGLVAGASYSDTFTRLTIPTTSKTGKLYLVAKADRYLVNGVIVETNESNNTRATPISITRK